jgi:hypothetical protein
MTTTIRSTEYRVEKISDAGNHAKLSADLVARGFDGCVYHLHGKRGAIRMAYRSARTGVFMIAA